MAQHRDYRPSSGARGQHEETGGRWRPGQQEESQRWRERPYAQDENRTQYAEDSERANWQRGYGQERDEEYGREAWPSEAEGYQGGPWNSQGGYSSRGGYGAGPTGGRFGPRGRYGEQWSGHGGPEWESGQGRYGQGGYSQGSYGSAGYGQGAGPGQAGFGQRGFGQGGYGPGGYGGYGQTGGYGQSGGGYSMGEQSGRGAWSGQPGSGGYGQAGQDWGSVGGGRRMWRGPKGYKRSDERLKEDISERLMQSGHIDPSEVTVEVQNGKVTLEGSVPERRMRHQIEDLVDECPGVDDIDNRVRVSRGEAGSGGTSEGTSASGTGTFGAPASSSRTGKKE